MQALIILAHGSRREESNQEVAALSEKVADLSKHRYRLVRHAFLEVASPSLPEAIDGLVADGILNINVIPYFLNSGNHVKRDIPGLIETAQQKYPDCQFSMVPCIGTHKDMPKFIMDLI